jgi:hypothetical protein
MSHFEAWYPQFGPRLNAIMLANCSEQLQYYRMLDPPYTCRGCEAQTLETCLPPNAPEWMKQNIGIGVGCLAEAVENCILQNAPEWMKANMAAAGVLLSLLPTILSLAGSSSAEIGLLGQRRPFLASLIAAGSSAVSPFWIFETREPDELLCKRSDTGDLLARRELGKIKRLAILIAQYTLAACAVVNVTHTSWQLGVQTLCSFSTETTFHPLLWAWAAVVAHIFGATAVKLRVTIAERAIGSSAPVPRTLRARIRDEFQLSAHQPHASIIRKRESYAFAFVSWCTSTGTILHLIYGTLTFSSILFISTKDALGVLGRYLISTIVCKVLLNFEIGGMRAVVHGEEANAAPEYPGNQQAERRNGSSRGGTSPRSVSREKLKLEVGDFSESPTMVFGSPDGSHNHAAGKDIPRSWSNCDTA